MAEDKTGYTLEELVAKLGTATKAEVKRYLAGAKDSSLVEEGREVGTYRVSTDAARLYGYALEILEKATPEHLDHLIGVSTDMLRVCVWAAAEGDRLWKLRQSAATQNTDDKAAALAEAEAERSEVLGRRDVLKEALHTLAGEDPKWNARIANAYGTIGSAEEIETSMTKLVAEARKLLADPDEGIAERRSKHRLDEAWLVKTEAMVAAFVKAAKAAEGALPRTPVEQGEVDWWDGANIWLLDKVIDLFDAAHRADPTIPRLIPISLRSVLGRHAKTTAPAKEPAPAEEPALDDA